MKKVALCILVLLITACAKSTEPKTGMDTGKDRVLSMINANTYASCEYKGRVVLKYEDINQSTNLRALINKGCSGYMEAKLLGPLGITVADIVMDDYGYRISKDGKDITNDPRFSINMADFMMAKEYMQLPPPLPDRRYDMLVDKDHYLFMFEDNYIVVSSDYRVVLAVKGDHTVAYEWENGGEIKSMSFSRGTAAINIKFSDEWIRE